MLKELQKLGWEIPGRLKLLRHRFLQVSQINTGISPPWAIRFGDDSNLEEEDDIE
jgi:hypothetical protein